MKKIKVKAEKKKFNLILIILAVIILAAVVLIVVKLGEEKVTGEVVSEEKVADYSYKENVLFSESTLKFQGYIIKFKDKPIIEKKVELEKSKIKGKITSELKKYKVTLKNNHKTISNKILQKLGKKDLKILNEYYNVFNGLALNITSEEAIKLKELPEVEAIYPNYEVHTTLMDSVPLINADDVWNMQDSLGRNITGEGITIAIIDTGIDYTHEDLGSCFGQGCKVMGGWDFVFNDADPMDDNGHGTHVAATAAGNGVLKGVAPNAKLYAFKVMNAAGSGSPNNIISAIERSYDLDNDGYVYGIDPEETNSEDIVDIISLSLGGYGNPDDAMSQSIDTAVENGVVAVVAAGNSGPSHKTILSPGGARKAITVGATYKKDYLGDYWGDINPQINQITIFSSRGPARFGALKPDIVAPGALICAARYDNIYPEGKHPYYYPCLDEEHVQFAGTSMATPHIAGAVALLKQAHPDWTPEEIKYTIIGTASNLEESPFIQGGGLINILRAVNSTTSYPISHIETNGSLFYKGGQISVKVKALGKNFESFKIYYALGQSYKNITSFNLIYNSTSPVNSKIISLNINTSNLEYVSEIIIKLEVKNNLFISNSYAYVPIQNPQSGVFPINLLGTILIPPKVAELSSDSDKNIIVNSWDLGGGELDIFQVLSFEGVPRFFKEEFQISNTAISDLDNDGNKEIIVHSGSLTKPHYKLNVYDLNGNQKENWPIELNSFTLDEPITIINLDNSGNKEILKVGEERMVTLISSDGLTMINLTNLFVDINKGRNMPIAIDINDDGKKEIVGINKQRDKIIAYNSSGVIIGGWSINLPFILNGMSNLIAGDIDKDGEIELIILDPYNAKIISIGTKNKKVEWVTNYAYPGGSANLLLADVNGDNFPEIIFLQKNIYIFNHQGNFLNKINIYSPTNFYFMNNLIATDINGDGVNEIIFAGSVLSFFKWDGTLAENYVNLGLDSDLLFPIVGDFDNDGETDILVFYNDPTWMGGQGDHQIYLVDLPYAYKKSKTDWPMQYYDLENTRCYRCQFCEDSDNGKNYTVKGNVTDETGTYTDECPGTAIVVENYCENGQKKIESFACSSLNTDSIKFRCENGACEKFCTVGWKCKDTSTRAYQNSDCSWTNLQKCKFGCSKGVCITTTPIPPTPPPEAEA